MSIVVEEIDEALFWFELIDDSGIVNNNQIISQKKGTEELVHIFAASRKTTKNCLRNSFQVKHKVKIQLIYRSMYILPGWRNR